MIESKELTGEVLEKPEAKFVVLTEDEISKMMKKAAREGAKEGIAAYESKQAIVMAERTEKVRNSAKTLIQHYRKLKKMKDTSVYDPDTVTDLTLAGIFDYILDECRKEEFELTSTKKNMLITGMLLNHVDTQLENYKKECEQSKIPDIERRYRVVEMMFLNEEPMKPDDVAEVENIDKSNVYRTLEKAYDDLTALFFGVEGLDVAEYRRKKRAEKKVARKTGSKNGAKKTQ
jgi:hypothetical protein